jgi:hypothetical protein
MGFCLFRANFPCDGPAESYYYQCCGSRSGIRCLFDPWIRIRNEQPGSYFLELRTNFSVKILEFFAVDPGSGMEKIRIRDPG